MIRSGLERGDKVALAMSAKCQKLTFKVAMMGEVEYWHFADMIEHFSAHLKPSLATSMENQVWQEEQRGEVGWRLAVRRSSDNFGSEYSRGRAAREVRATLRCDLRASLVCFALLLASGAAAHADNATITDLITERLNLMKDVAAYKYLAGVPVEDPDREALVVAHAADEAGKAGLDGKVTVPFFAAQIEAAKAMQLCWIARWTNGAASPPAEAPDLSSEIRPRLSEIGDAQIAALAATSPEDVEIGPLPAIDCLPPAAADEVLSRLEDLLAASR